MPQSCVGGACAARSFFSAAPLGRRIHVGFSHLQRIGKGASTDVWFSDFFKRYPDTPLAWAAIRQFELLQEAGNLAIEDMDVMNMNRTMQTMMKMRGGGYRITLITLGDYTDEPERDDLTLLDQKLQDEITQMIHFLYLSEASAHANTLCEEALARGTWCLEDHLPHVVRTLQAKSLFKPQKETLAEKTFLALLRALPARHIVHDTAVGLVLPDATKEKNWCYIAAAENTFATFQKTMTNVLGGLDKTMASIRHMRGYGDRLGSPFQNWGALPV